MEAFRAGTGEAVDILKTLGVEAEEFSKLNPEEQFVKLYEVTKDLNEQQKLEFFNKLGLDNLNLVFNRMDQIEKKKEEIQKTGLVITDEESGRLKDFENSWNGFTNNLKTFSTIIYSSLIPATQDAFDGIFGGFELSRDGASMFSMFLIEIVQFFAKIGNVGRLAFDMLTNTLGSIS